MNQSPEWDGEVFEECWKFPNMEDFILDTIHQTVVEVVLEGTFFIILDLQSYLVELNHILINMLTILHEQEHWVSAPHLQWGHAD